jgi:DNA mismatch endonuclease (patch repair protein)
VDRVDKKTRSRVMATVRKANTKLEESLVAILGEEDLAGYIRYAGGLPGSPDFVFPAQRVAIFLDSCFWHGCRMHLRMPKSRVDYWRRKIATNRDRDRRQTQELRARGWGVLRIWEHELENRKAVVRKIRRALD